MRYLTVLFDARCALCRRARAWLSAEPQYVELRFVAAASDQARYLFPDLDPATTLGELTVVSDQAEVFRGAKAWLMCLWALWRYRGLALDLATPRWMPQAKRFVAWVAAHRGDLGSPLVKDVAGGQGRRSTQGRG